LIGQKTHDIAIVGAGIAGLLLARELVTAGRAVIVLERGTLKTHAEQIRDRAHAVNSRTARPNHEIHPDTPGDDWDYVYGVGGSALHWGGVTPRLQAADLELRSRFGVGRDWLVSYAALEPFYEAAERALSVAGGRISTAGHTYRAPLPAHPFSPVDHILKPYLAPYFSLPQARPTRPVHDRPACCGSGECQLCPVDARYSPLHTLQDGLSAEPGFDLRVGTIVSRARSSGREWALDLVDASGEHSRLVAKTAVLAANGIENAAILLRSDLGGEDVGRWLADHQHAQYEIETTEPAGAGHGSSIATCISYAWADGEWRRERGSQLVYPDNRGRYMGNALIRAIASGRRGSSLRAALTREFDLTIVLDSTGEDLPQAGRRIELSPNRDSFGLPLNRVRYPPDSAYLERARALLRKDLERRLRPIGGRITVERRYRGGHQLGTCRMGTVVDEDCRLNGRDGLYVVGGSAFPSYSAAHPTLTIAALAIRLGRHLAERST
jgi:choline dehydrogenase-like flavoprotein